MQGHGGAEIALPEQPPETIAPPARDPTTKGCCRKSSSPSSRMLEERGAGVAPSRSSPQGVQEGAATPHCTCPNPKKNTASPGGAAAEPTPPPLPLVQGTEEHQPTPATPTSTQQTPPAPYQATSSPPYPKKKKPPRTTRRMRMRLTWPGSAFPISIGDLSFLGAWHLAGPGCSYFGAPS